MVALDHAHAAQRFRQPSGYFGSDLPALAEDGPHGAEGFLQGNAETGKDPDGRGGHRGADLDEDGEGKQSREEAAHKLHHARADEVPQAFYVTHDPRDERPGLGRVVEGDGQASHVRLHLAPEIGDQPLRLLRQELREGEGGNPLDRCRPDHCQNERDQHLEMALLDDVVDQVPRRGG